jgi:AcrR family transcriptional regulator
MNIKEEIKKSLPHGYYTEIAKRAGVSRTAVSKFFSTESINLKIEAAAVEVFEEVQQQRKALANRVHNALK